MFRFCPLRLAPQNPSRVILSEPQVSRTFAVCRKSAVGFSPMRNLGRTTLFAVLPREISSGEQRENATVRRFLEAKSSPQGVEGEGYAPTRNDYVAGQGGFRSHGFRYSTFASVSSRSRVYVAFPSGGSEAARGE